MHISHEIDGYMMQQKPLVVKTIIENEKIKSVSMYNTVTEK